MEKRKLTNYEIEILSKAQSIIEDYFNGDDFVDDNEDEEYSESHDDMEWE
jgi:hypothetical protein